MSYLNQARDPRRNTEAVIAVGAIHAAIGYALLTGLNVGDIVRVVDIPLISRDYPPPPPPPAPTPTPTSAAQPKLSDPVAPLPPIPLPPPPNLPAKPFDGGPIGDSVPRGGGDDGALSPVTPPPPPPMFTPRGARPSNNTSRWITTDDYPRQPLVEGIEGTARYSLGIGTDGRVADCKITTSSGNRALDAATCKYLASRARFEAATDGNGAKVAGSYSGSVHWEIPD